MASFWSLLWIGVSCSAWASEQYVVRTWQAEDGLPQNSGTAIVQTSDGYIWVGTFNGLARFNGINFTQFTVGNTKELPSGDIQVLYEDRAGRLWIGTDVGLVSYNEGRFKHWREPEKLRAANINSLVETREGDLIVAAADGVWRVAKDRVTEVVVPGAEWSKYATRAAASRDGEVWVAHGPSLFRLGGTELRLETRLDLPVGYWLAVGPNGTIWWEGDAKILHWKPGQAQQDLGVNVGPVRALIPTLEGDLWIGSETKGLFRWRNGRLTSLSAADGLGSDRVLALAADREGGVWVGTDGGGLSRVRRTELTTYTMEHGLSFHDVISVAEDALGRIWLGTVNAGLCVGENERWQRFLAPDILEPDEGVSSVCLGRDRTLWVGGWQRSLCRIRDGRMEVDPRSRVAGVRVLFEDRAGGLWIGSANSGAECLRGDKADRWDTSHGLSHNRVTAIAQDATGAIWVGTKNGLNRIRSVHRNAESSHAAADSLHEPERWPPARPNRDEAENRAGSETGAPGFTGRVKEANDKANLAGPSNVSFPLTPALSRGERGDPRPPSGKPDAGGLVPAREKVLPLPEGEGWGEGEGDGEKSQTVRFVQRAGSPHPVPLPKERVSGTPLWTTRDRRSVLPRRQAILPLPPGEGRGEGNGAQANFSGARIFPMEAGAETLPVAGSGTNDEAIVIDRFYQQDGLGANQVHCLFVDREGILWVGTAGGGLSCYRQGKLATVTSRHGLPSDVVCQILEDDEGNLWVGSTRGILFVKKQSMHDVLEGRARLLACMLFDRNHGMRTTDCTGGFQPACAKTRDGRLWFCTSVGVTVVDPRLIRRDSLPPPVHVERLLADGVELTAGRNYGQVLASGVPAEWNEGKNLGETGDRRRETGEEAWKSEIRSPKSEIQNPKSKIQNPNSALRTPHSTLILVPPGVRRLAFECAALSFSAPEQTQFQFWLEGYEDTWQDAGTRRVAHYSRVPPGRYRFRVKAVNNEGVWNESGATLALLVQPAWWQTRQFQATMMLLVIGTLAALYHRRVNGLKRARIQQAAFARRLIESQENERKRIAAELHDSLGQTILIVKNRAFLGLQQQDGSPILRQQLKSILEMASGALREVRQIARALRPPHLERLSLSQVIQTLADQTAEAGNLRVELCLDDLEGLFSPEQRLILYRIVQESLSNVMKHARAAKVQLNIRREGGRVRLQIEDDGCGFDATCIGDNTQSRSGLGLLGLAERTRMLGGVFSVQSTPGQGTRVIVEIPVAETSGPLTSGKAGGSK